MKSKTENKLPDMFAPLRYLHAMGMDKMSVALVGHGDYADGRMYRPAADISNLFPQLLDACCNVVGSVDSALEDRDDHVGRMRRCIAALAAYVADKPVVEELAVDIQKKISDVEQYDKEGLFLYLKSFLFMCLLAYGFSTKGQLSTENTSAIKPDISHYFALNEIVSHLSEDTRKRIARDLCGKGLYYYVFGHDLK